TYFSLFEGFGIPLLEAFHMGTPVLCANTTSLPDIGGDAVLSCDPTDVSAIANLMMRIVNEPILRSELAERGKQRRALSQWEAWSQNLLDACHRVGERPLVHHAVLDSLQATFALYDRTIGLGKTLIAHQEYIATLQNDLGTPPEEVSRLGAECEARLQLLN